MADTWMTAEQEAWVKKLITLAKKQPKGIIVHTTGSGFGCVVVPMSDYNRALLHPDRAENIPFKAIDGGDPDWEILT